MAVKVEHYSHLGNFFLNNSTDCQDSPVIFSHLSPLVLSSLRCNSFSIHSEVDGLIKPVRKYYQPALMSSALFPLFLYVC